MIVHSHQDGHSKKALGVAIAATALILVVEVAGGVWTNSLALLSDAAHVLMDLLSFALTLFAIRLAERPASDERTYGWHRMEVFAAAVNGITVFGIACAIFFQALRRLAAPEPVLGAPMLVIASVGLVVNVFVIWKLHPHVGEDVNLRGAFLHAFGDAFASLAVVCGGLIMMKTGSSWADPLAAIVVSVIIVAGAFRLLRDSAHILLEGTPRGVSRGLVIQDIESVAGPGSVRDLHIWNLCSHLCALSVHVLLKESAMPRQARILSEIRSLLSAKFGIVHSTVQIESETWMESSHAKESSPHGQS